MGPTTLFAIISAGGIWLVSKLKDTPNSSVVNIGKTNRTAFLSSGVKDQSNGGIVTSTPPNLSASKAGGASSGGCCCRNSGGTGSKTPTLVSAAPGVGNSSPAPAPGSAPTTGQPVKDYGPFSFLGV